MFALLDKNFSLQHRNFLWLIGFESSTVSWILWLSYKIVDGNVYWSCIYDVISVWSWHYYANIAMLCRSSAKLKEVKERSSRSSELKVQPATENVLRVCVQSAETSRTKNQDRLRKRQIFSEALSLAACLIWLRFGDQVVFLGLEEILDDGVHQAVELAGQLSDITEEEKTNKETKR